MEHINRNNDNNNENKTEPCDDRIHPISSWDDLELSDDLLRGIYAYGFENPSDIQKKAIYPIIHKHDTIAHAQSGTGKTGAFTVSSLQLLDMTKDHTQVLIMAPTHELVNQIIEVVTSLSIFMEGIRIKSLIGGTSIREDVASLQNSRPHIVVGTTGRVTDMINRNYLDISMLEIMILDESDELLSSGFKDAIYNIFKYLNVDTQIAIFSATMPTEVVQLTTRFMKTPVSIMIKADELSLDGISQFYIALSSDSEKYNVLKDIFQKITVSQCIIYINNINRIHELYNTMIKDGYPVCCIHSSMDRSEREDTIRDFKGGKYRTLLSSNLTARGIDVQQVGTVINFDVPNCVHTYLHRIGRSGRWGRKGLAINFVTKFDIANMRKIETHYSITIPELTNTVLGI
jgi:translation initiation factor 4A